MKKNNLTLAVVLIAGLLLGSILSQLLEGVSQLAFLTKSAQIVWQPSADFDVVKYDIFLQVKLNLLNLIGLAAAIWIYRKL